MAKTKTEQKRASKGRTYNPHTRAGRKKIDDAVRGQLSAVITQSRGEIAAALPGLPADAVSASLRRGIRDGWADPQGETSVRVYRAAGKETGR